MILPTYKVRHSTPLGDIELIGTDIAVTAMYCLEGSDIKPNVAEARVNAALTETPPMILQQCIAELDEYFRGDRREFTIPLAPEGSEFERRVWSALQEVPFGITASYSDLTARMGDMNAIRAVAAANGRNPIWILIPCHRIIGKNGDLTGYAGGLWRKEWLLKHEDALPQHSLF